MTDEVPECNRSWSIAADSGRDPATLKLWSAGAASALDPCSMAILWHECRNTWPTWDIEILASDISNKMLARATEASDTEVEVNRGLTPAGLATHFQRENDQ